VSGPPPEVAAVRHAVRPAVLAVPEGALLLVACSGGPDSTALASALAHEAPRAGRRAGLMCVDHAWSPASAGVAQGVLLLAARLGLTPAEVLHAPTARSEGAARTARRTALAEAAERLGAATVLLGHSLDDQAETVLLRLARGSGARSLAGMPAADALVRRPLLGLRRATTRAACRAEGLPVWDDPANDDPAFTRSRVRTQLLPALEQVLGPGAVPALARSADLLRADADALDALAGAAAARLGVGMTAAAARTAQQLPVAGLVELDPAVRARVLRRAALCAGSSASALTAAHVAALDALVLQWSGQGPLHLPGIKASRADGTIYLVATETAPPVTS